MVIFHSYVSFPEGTPSAGTRTWNSLVWLDAPVTTPWSLTEDDIFQAPQKSALLGEDLTGEDLLPG